MTLMYELLPSYAPTSGYFRQSPLDLVFNLLYRVRTLIPYLLQ